MIIVNSIEMNGDGSGKLILIRQPQGGKSFLLFRKAPSDVIKLKDRVIEVTNHAIYLLDDMIAWRIGGDGIEFMTDTISELLDA